MHKDHSLFFREVVGADYVLDNPDLCETYYYDEIELSMRPLAHKGSLVVKPADASEISAILTYANQNNIPVVVRGGGTGLCGGAIPTQESVVISMERLNRVLEIDQANMMATVEAGVTLFRLLEALEAYPGIGFPVHPGDEGAQIGGMAVTNAGGARAVRHGITRSHVKGIEVVLADGTILTLGGKLLKDNAGYNLMQLVLGSEGTLAVITKVILRLYPEEKYSASTLVSFPDVSDASEAVLSLVNSGIPLLAVEYQDKWLNLETAKMLGIQWPLVNGNADLLIILSEKTEADLYRHAEEIDRICDRHGALESFIACARQEQADVLAVRSGSYEVIKHDIYHSFDMAVPPAAMPQFMRELKEAAQAYGAQTNVLAHIADGNVHNDILLVDGEIPPYYEALRDRMYKACFSLGGTITGEHGIGKLRVQDLKRQKPEAELRLMARVKRAFDPKGILNPGAVLDAFEKAD